LNREILNLTPVLDISLSPECQMLQILIASNYYSREETIDATRRLLSDPSFEPVLRNSRGMLPVGLSSYFLDSVERIAALGYIPSDDDILHLHETADKTAEDVFVIDDFCMSVFDLGERTPEVEYRCCDKSMDVLIFTAALDTDIVSSVCTLVRALIFIRLIFQTRMECSMALFSSICNNPCFEQDLVVSIQ
jgi:guanine nucleotide-binding protein G(i) subunit alpha